MARVIRRERRYEAALNVPMTNEMRRNLEAVAQRGDLAMVEVARRCINRALPEVEQDALAERRNR